MTTYSNAAKVLAVLTFTAGVTTDAKALELFDLLIAAKTYEKTRALMNEYDFTPWDPVAPMSTFEWLWEIENLAKNFDRVRAEVQ